LSDLYVAQPGRNVNVRRDHELRRCVVYALRAVEGKPDLMIPLDRYHLPVGTLLPLDPFVDEEEARHVRKQSALGDAHQRAVEAHHRAWNHRDFASVASHHFRTRDLDLSCLTDRGRPTCLFHDGSSPFAPSRRRNMEEYRRRLKLVFGRSGLERLAALCGLPLGEWP
jgi:hypothetical protein